MTVATLPPELAPTLRAAAEQLLAECGEADRPFPSRPRTDQPAVCFFCQKPGKLGGHHLDPATVVWAHKGCHRRHHAAQKAARFALGPDAQAVPDAR